MIHLQPSGSSFPQSLCGNTHTHTLQLFISWRGQCPANISPFLCPPPSSIFNSPSQREAVTCKLLGNARRKLHPKPGVQAAPGRCPAGRAPERPGWGPVSEHPEAGAQRQGRDFERGWGEVLSPRTPVVASPLRTAKLPWPTWISGEGIGWQEVLG